jgi:hypothetical protein
VGRGARRGAPLGRRAAARGEAGTGVPGLRARLRARPSRPLQLPVPGGGLPGLPRLRPHPRHRLGQGHPRGGAEHRGGSPPALDRALQRMGARAAGPLREVEPHPARRSLARSPARAAQAVLEARRLSRWRYRDCAPGSAGWSRAPTRCTFGCCSAATARTPSAIPAPAPGSTPRAPLSRGRVDLAAWHRLEVAEAHRRLESLPPGPGR